MTITAESIHQSAQQLAAETTELRRDFHRHPELAFQEVRTSGIVAERLQALGLQVRSGVGKTGVVAVLDSGRAGKTVLARADMDALPIDEERDTPYRSTVANIMHACGHDGHTAVLLSVAKLFCERKADWSGKLVFIFQPAEETVGGAQKMLEDNALEGLHIDASIGLHLGSHFPVGMVALRAGPAMAATDSMHIVVRGHGGHAARPQECVDPVIISAQLISGLQSLVSREVDPLDNAVISITSVHGGSAHNIIPEQVELKGTLRTFKAETRQQLKDRIASYSEGIANSLRGSASLEWIDQSPAVVNDAAMTARMQRVAEAVVGADKVVEAEPIMGGDDMALWLQQAPGCYFFVGAGNVAAGIDKPHHHPQFDIDEASLPLAVELFSQGILDYLG